MLLTGDHATPLITLFFSLTHVTCMTLHHTVVIMYSTSVTYGTLYHSRGHLVIYRECYGFEIAFLTLKRFLPCTHSCFFQRFLCAGSSTSKLAGLHADLRNIVLAWLFVWITTIHKRNICGRFYLKVGLASHGTIIFTEHLFYGTLVF